MPEMNTRAKSATLQACGAWWLISAMWRAVRPDAIGMEDKANRAAQRFSELPDVWTLSFQVDGLLQNLVRHSDDSGVGLIASLCNDHPRELFGNIDIRLLEYSADDLGA